MNKDNLKMVIESLMNQELELARTSKGSIKREHIASSIAYKKTLELIES